MKTLIKVSGKIVLLGLIILFSSCGDEELKAKIERQAQEINKLQDSIDKLNHGTQIIDLYPPTGKPENILPFKTIKQLYDRYDLRAELLEKIEGQNIDNFVASRSITFSYQELVNYFDFIEQLTEKTGERISGLRFYFGKYADDKERTPGQQLLFFNPTINTKDAAGNPIELAYSIINSGDKPRIIFLKDRDHRNINQGSFLSFNLNSNQEPIDLSEQGGQISPPPKNNNKLQ